MTAILNICEIENEWTMETIYGIHTNVLHGKLHETSKIGIKLHQDYVKVEK